MNPELQYPEIKDMNKDEVFVEWAYIIKPSGVTKLHTKVMVPKKTLNAFNKGLKELYQADEVELVTISK